MLNINQLITSSESNMIKEISRSPFYESASLVVSEKSLNLDYNIYQLKRFINSRTSGEGFKEAIKGGLQKIWKFIKGIIDMIVKGFNNFWTKLKSIFTRKKKDVKKEDTKVDDSVAKKEAAEYKKKVEELNKELEKTLDEKENLQDQIKNIQKESKYNKIKLEVEIEEKKKLQNKLEDKIKDMEAKISKLETDGKSDKITIDRLRRENESLNKDIIYAEKRYTKLENKHAEEYGELKVERMLKDITYVTRHIRSLCNVVDTRFFEVLGFKGRFNDKDYMEKKAIPELKSKIDYDISKRGDTIDTSATGRRNIGADEIIESLNTRIERLNIQEIKDVLAKGYDVNDVEKQKTLFSQRKIFYIVDDIRDMIGANRSIKQTQKR